MKEIILAGRPNSGKSTLFNALSGGNQKVGNYAGCTVEKKTSEVTIDGFDAFELTDLPGIYSLQPNSFDEEVAINHLKAKRKDSVIVFVLDGNNISQELTLPIMLKRSGYDVVIAVNMIDEVQANKKILNLTGMADLAGIPFFPISAKTGEGVNALAKFMAKHTVAIADQVQSASLAELHSIAKHEAKKLNELNPKGGKNLQVLRDEKFDKILLNKFLGPVIFLAVMFVLFQSIFTWAAPLSDLIDAGIGFAQEFVKGRIANDLVASLVSDGLLAGVGSVVVFIPQIAILFLLIGLLEYSGYLPRIAYMVDRLMKPYGLDGKVFIPLLSSVACAVPGIMATRTIENQRTRIITVMISPLMTCSARLPVYTLLIGSFVPATKFGPFSLQGLVMFGMYAVAVVMALVVALILHNLEFQKRQHAIDIMHLPHYRSPNWKELIRFVRLRVLMFMKKAGTIIAAMSILLWAMLTFPKVESPAMEQIKAIEARESQTDADKTLLASLQAQQASYQLENSIGGRLGKAVAPVFKPLGYDWKLTIGIMASMAAREVFVSTLGTVFSLGEVDENSSDLADTLRSSKNADGTPKYTIATCLSLLMFFAFSLQCISTIGVAKRETNSWKIPAIMFVYMFVVAYLSAYVAYTVADFIFV